MTARDIEDWRAWYELEPRGDERRDWQTAVLALANAAEGTTLAEIVELIRDQWTPITEAEAKRRKRRKTRKWQRRLSEYGRQASGEDRTVKHGKHR